MKRILLLIPFFMLLSNAPSASAQEGYGIKIRLKGYHSGKVFLAHYAGDKTYLTDSCEIDKEGWLEFKGKEHLQHGIYMLALGRVKLFEFLVKEQYFTLVTDTADFAAHMKVTGSPENEIFIAYQLKAGEIGYQVYLTRERLKAADKSGNQKLSKEIRDTLTILVNKEKEYYKQIIREKPNSLLAKILLTMQETEIPVAAKNDKGQIIDTSSLYHQFLYDYWKDIDFSCEGLAYTPVFQTRLQQFFDRFVIPQPDTVIKWADYVIGKSKANKQIFRFTVQYLTNSYANNQYLCMDAVPVHLILKYYTHDQAFWVDSAGIVSSRMRAEALLPTLCGKRAPDIAMHDSALERKIIKIVESDTNVYSRSQKIYSAIASHGSTSLYDVKSPYTVLMFWDPDCSHCKAEMPKLEEIYNKYKDKGVVFYSACVEQEYDKWIKFINEHHHTWINVIDMYNISEFRKLYDISSTPVIFLLDKDKNIIAKKLAGNSLEQLLEFEFKKIDGK